MAKVLVVDDEEVTRFVTGRVLQDSGHDVTYAGDGESALERIRTGNFDVVVSDLAMPKMNGLQLVRAVHELHPGLPVIAISGQNADQLILAEDFGAVATIYKPVEPARLLSEIEKATQVELGIWTQAYR